MLIFFFFFNSIFKALFNKLTRLLHELKVIFIMLKKNLYDHRCQQGCLQLISYGNKRESICVMIVIIRP